MLTFVFIAFFYLICHGIIIITSQRLKIGNELSTYTNAYVMYCITSQRMTEYHLIMQWKNKILSYSFLITYFFLNYFSNTEIALKI